MHLDNQEKKYIAVRALTLQERLNMPAEADTEHLTEDFEDWLEEWMERVAGDDFGTFLRRLEISNLSIEECRRRTRVRNWPQNEPLPQWINCINDILAFTDIKNLTNQNLTQYGGNKVPFTHVLTLIVKYASNQINWSVSRKKISNRAIAEFEQCLLGRLYTLFAHPLFIEFKAFLALHGQEENFAENQTISASESEYYDSFVRYLFQGGLKLFFIEYSVLSRLLALTQRGEARRLRSNR